MDSEDLDSALTESFWHDGENLAAILQRVADGPWVTLERPAVAALHGLLAHMGTAMGPQETARLAVEYAKALVTQLESEHDSRP